MNGKNIIVGLLAFVVLVLVFSMVIGVSMARGYTGCDTLGNKPTNGSGQFNNNRR